MRILVFGAGAIGGFVGGCLAVAGHQVIFLGREPFRQAVLREGLCLYERDANGQPQPATGFPVHPLVVTDVAAVPDWELLDLILLTVKSYQTDAAIAALRSQPLGRGTTLLSLQNGIGNEAALAGVFGRDRVLAGSLTTSVSGLAPAKLLRNTAGGLAVAPLDPRGPAGVLLPLVAESCNEQGLLTRIYTDADAVKWSKLLLNLLGNAQSALLGWDAPRVFAHPALFALEQAQLREALSVMQRRGTPVVDLPGFAVRQLAQVMRLPAALVRPLLRRKMGRGRGEKRPSFALDLERGRPTEAAWLNGAVAREGKRLGLPTPINQALAALLEAAATDASLRLALRDRPAALLAEVFRARNSDR